MYFHETELSFVSISNTRNFSIAKLISIAALLAFILSHPSSAERKYEMIRLIELKPFGCISIIIRTPIINYLLCIIVSHKCVKSDA